MTRSLTTHSGPDQVQSLAARRAAAPPLALPPRRDPVPWLRASDWRPAQVLVWGAHGGAGTTTMTAWMYPACDMGSMRPGVVPRYPAWVANGRPVVFTCGTTAYAARAATGIGRRNRSNLAADGAAGIPWVLAGLTLIALSSGIVAVFV